MSKRKTPTSSSPDALTVVPGREVTYHNEPTLTPVKPSRGAKVKLASPPPARAAKTQRKHQRYVQISVVVPASVKLLVGTDDEEPDDDTEWEILSVRDVHCEPTVQLITESMDGTDFAALTEAANKTKDVE